MRYASADVRKQFFIALDRCPGVNEARDQSYERASECKADLHRNKRSNPKSGKPLEPHTQPVSKAAGSC